MEQLKVIGTEEGVLVLATESGERYALPIDETLRSAAAPRTASDNEPRAARRALATSRRISVPVCRRRRSRSFGARLEDVQRFERPVLAEREHIVGQALAVPVLIAGELDAAAQPTFGSRCGRSSPKRARAVNAGRAGRTRTAGSSSSSSRRTRSTTTRGASTRAALAPLNADATQLSRQGSLPEGLIPACARSTRRR
jgi:hypothetical protein